MTFSERKSFLDEKADFYNNPTFIESDPIQIPHLFERKEDIEIAAFLTATIAWGNRKSIINNARKMMDLLENAPFDFVMNHRDKDLRLVENFVHRTFNGQDFVCFIQNLQYVYQNCGGLEVVFKKYADKETLQSGIHQFKKVFFEKNTDLIRTKKHVSDPLNGSAAKRINMFLRWMVRNDRKGVDLGIWKSLSPAQLSCPLDVHSGNVARKLGLLTRKQNDAKAVTELDRMLRKMDASDPVKYDFALFGLGVFERF